MRLVIADTGPINYLILIGHIDLLPNLFEKVILPSVVQAELTDPDAPPSVRKWVATPPGWLEVRETEGNRVDDDSLKGLDDGERAAIVLAGVLNADLLLMDDREAVIVARRKGFVVTGTLGILDLAAERGLVDLAAALVLLRKTNFRYRLTMLDALLKKHTGE